MAFTTILKRVSTATNVTRQMETMQIALDLVAGIEESIQITTFVNKANEAMITEETMTSKKSIADVMLKGVHKPEQEGVCKIIYSKKKRFYIEPL